VKAIGKGPRPFSGDRAQAEDFITEVKQYLRLNRDVPGFDSPIKKVSYTLSYVQGPKVAAWANAMGVWVDRLQPHENIPAVWDQFLETFARQFQDSGAEQQARNDLAKHVMKWPLIDQYISDFEELARKAGYNQANDETVQMFLKGLPVSVLKEVLRAPFVQGYGNMKQRALESVKAQQAIQNLLGGRATLPMNFGTPSRRPQPPRFQTPRIPNRPRFTSTNAPPAFNNRPVPMDVDRTRVPRTSRWGNQGVQTNAAAPAATTYAFSADNQGISHENARCVQDRSMPQDNQIEPLPSAIIVENLDTSHETVGEARPEGKHEQTGERPSQPSTIWTPMTKTRSKHSSLCSLAGSTKWHSCSATLAPTKIENWDSELSLQRRIFPQPN
jgi:hypothetical protein